MCNKDIKNNVMTFEEIWSIELIVFKLLGISLRNALVCEYYKPSLLDRFKFISEILGLCIFCCLCINTLNVVRFNDVNNAAEVFTLTLSVLMCIIKASTMWFCQRKLFVLFKDFNILWHYARTKFNSQSKINRLMNKSKMMRQYYLFTTVFLGFTYILRPYCVILIHYMKKLFHVNSNINFSITTFPIKYPFAFEAMYKYILLVLYEQWIAFCGLMFWTACDISYIQLTTHLRINLMVLSNDISNLDQFKDTDYNYNAYYLIVKLVNRHRYILSIFNKVNNLYNPILLFTMLFNGLDLCCCVFTLDKELSDYHWSKVGRSIAHAITLFVQIIIYCNYSHLATEMTVKISYSIYNLEWRNYDVKLVKMLIIIMVRANKQSKFSAYGVFELSRPHMTKIIRRTIGYLTLLRSFS